MEFYHKSLRYQYTPNDHHSLVPLYGRTFRANPGKVYTVFVRKKVSYFNMNFPPNSGFMLFGKMSEKFPEFKYYLRSLAVLQIWRFKEEFQWFSFLEERVCSLSFRLETMLRVHLAIYRLQRLVSPVSPLPCHTYIQLERNYY